MLVGMYIGTTVVSAALIDGTDVRAAVALPATVSLTGGAGEVLLRLVKADRDARTVHGVTVSTSRLEEAVVRADGLARTGCIRLCAAWRDAVPPLAGWPEALHDTVGGHVFQCQGGHEFDGTQPEPIDPLELEAAARELAADGVGTVAVTAVFSPVDGGAELAAADLLRDRLSGLHVSLSHEIGTIGLLERENATIINAALLPVAEQFADALSAEVRASVPDATVYLAQSDGTVAELSFGERYPILTFGAGTTGAMRGAATLSGHPDCVAVDLGLETAEIGLVRAGSPRQVLRTTEIGGVRTSLRGPETHRVPVRADVAERLDRAIATIDPDGVLPVVLVGRGDPGSSWRPDAIRPRWGEVVRAVGVAGTRIGAVVDCIVAGQPIAHARSLERAKALASQRAVMAGAAHHTVSVAEIEETPLAYLPGDFVHLRVKAVGDIG